MKLFLAPINSFIILRPSLHRHLHHCCRRGPNLTTTTTAAHPVFATVAPTATYATTTATYATTTATSAFPSLWNSSPPSSSLTSSRRFIYRGSHHHRPPPSQSSSSCSISSDDLQTKQNLRSSNTSIMSRSRSVCLVILADVSID